MVPPLRIIFMGTPEFAVPSLRGLVEDGYNVVGVLTAPDRAAGRGQKPRPSAVKAYASNAGLPVFQPTNLKAPAFVAEFAALQPDLAVVVAFRMLPRAIWQVPRLGTFNLHASLLPDYRGAAPINWAIINGETRTGATTFFIDEKIDTGQILLQRAVDIPDAWTAGDLHDKLMHVGADLVVETVRGLEAGTLQPQPQDETRATHPAPKIFKPDCEIDWDQPAARVRNFVRGLAPYPGAYTTAGGQPVKIFALRQDSLPASGQPGAVQLADNTLHVRAQDAWLRVEELQWPGKKRLKTVDFLRGFNQPLARFGGLNSETHLP